VTYRAEIPPGESVADLPWWELFADPVLEDLIRTALANNRNLRVAAARIDQARASLGIVRADLFPRVDYGADGSISRATGTDTETIESASAALSASYQVDLWGRIRRSNEAALQELLATEEAYRGVTITLVAQVASSYFLLRDLDNRLAIAERTAETRRQSLDIVESRFRAGVVSEVDVAQAEIQLAQAEGSIETFKRLRAQTENAISVLLGAPPMSIERGLPIDQQALAPEVPVGLPSELLERRPDILEAERRLHAQTARIGVAQALRLPQFTLSADMAGQFTDVSTGIFSLGAQLFGPLIDSGQSKRRVDVEVARAQQLLAAYEQTILNALREVEDALVAVDTYQGELAARLRQLEASRKAAELTWVRYDGGMTSFLEVLDLQRSLFSSELSASETRQLQLSAVVQLYQALGGGWVAAQDSLAVIGDR
jgi:multidrug efflux system outer membrane protein